MPLIVARAFARRRKRERRRRLEQRRRIRQRLWIGRSWGARVRHFAELGDLWMWLQLMWLQFDVARGPVAIIFGRFGVGLGSQPTPNDTDWTSDNLKLRPHEL